MMWQQTLRVNVLIEAMEIMGALETGLPQHVVRIQETSV